MQRQNTVLRLALLLVMAAMFGCIASNAWACPTCAEGVADGSAQGRGFASALYYSILFMMSMPFIIFGTVGTIFYRSVRRARAEQDAAALIERAADGDSDAELRS